MEIQTATIIGQGNVAYHYCDIMNKRGVKTKAVSSRLQLEKEELLTDLIIIAVKDDAIEQVANSLAAQLAGLSMQDNACNTQNLIAVHTSGYMSTQCLKKISPNYGSLYPLQTLKKGIDINFSKVPLCIWGSNKTTLQNLESLVGKLSNIHYILEDNQRKTLHLAAVFANNFPNHLFGIAKRILDKENVPFDILFPLIDRTISAIKQHNPFSVQTGPAFRGETAIMEQHKQRLNDTERKIYEIISESIIQQCNNNKQK